MKKITVFMMALLLLALCGCQKAQPAAPATSAPTTAPAKAEEEATQPAVNQQAIPKQDRVVEGLVCYVTVGDQAEKKVENPLASDLYYYLLNCRKEAVENTPPVDIDIEGIQFSFKVDDRQSHRYWVYADDYAAIPTSTNSDVYRYFAFPEGCYNDLFTTVG